MNVRFLFPLMLTAALFVGCKNNVEEPAPVAEPETPQTEVVSTFDLPNMEAKELANFKDGEGTLLMKMAQDGDTKVMLCTMPAGSSVGYHLHDTSLEVILVQKGAVTINFDGVDQVYTEGQVHYCPKGHSHSISNLTDSEAVIYNVVAAQ